MDKPLNLQVELPWIDKTDTSDSLYFTSDRFALRLEQGGASIVAGLTRDQGEKLRDALSDWVKQP